MGDQTMRWIVMVGLIAGFGSGMMAQADQEERIPARYGIEPDLDHYPQATPKETLASVLQAIQRERINYLLAHLADPAFVDERVRGAGRDFEAVVRETTTKLADNPQSVQELQRFLQEGEWESSDTAASAQLKDVKDRRVFLRKIRSRWFLENRQETKKEPPR